MKPQKMSHGEKFSFFFRVSEIWLSKIKNIFPIRFEFSNILEKMYIFLLTIVIQTEKKQKSKIFKK